MKQDEITANPPTAEELRRFSSQFAGWEWQYLCHFRPFTNTLMQSIPRAAFQASVILKRPVQYLSATESDRQQDTRINRLASYIARDVLPPPRRRI